MSHTPFKMSVFIRFYKCMNWTSHTLMMVTFCTNCTPLSNYKIRYIFFKFTCLVFTTFFYPDRPAVAPPQLQKRWTTWKLQKGRFPAKHKHHVRLKKKEINFTRDLQFWRTALCLALLNRLKSQSFLHLLYVVYLIEKVL